MICCSVGRDVVEVGSCFVVQRGRIERGIKCAAADAAIVALADKCECCFIDGAGCAFDK